MRSKPNAGALLNDAPPSRGDAFGDAVRRCRDDAALLSGLKDIYRRADAAFAQSGAVCLGGGACCKFDLTQHRLYLSTGELALLTEVAPPKLRSLSRGRCPYQVGPRCAARNRRPLGCRMFFCQENFDPALQKECELYHREIRVLHETHCVPYAYAELVRALVQLFMIT